MNWPNDVLLGVLPSAAIESVSARASEARWRCWKVCKIGLVWARASVEDEGARSRSVSVCPQWALAHQRFESQEIHGLSRGTNECRFFLLAKDFQWNLRNFELRRAACVDPCGRKFAVELWPAFPESGAERARIRVAVID
jgi:hypothetical protein